MKIIIFSSILFVLTILNMQSAESYRILGLFPLELKSHFIMFEALMKGLARKGHQVDVISTYSQKKPYPNYTDLIELPFVLSQVITSATFEGIREFNPSIPHIMTSSMGNTLCEHLGHPKLLNLIRNPPSDPPYDLMITEVFTAQCFIAVGHHLKIPTIGVSSTVLYPWIDSMIANPSNFAFVSNVFLDYVPPLNFWQRFYNTFYSVFNDLYFRHRTRVQDDIIKKYIGADAPGVRELESTLALILTNTHISVNGVRPMTTAVVEVGGLHIESNDATVSEDLKKWMDDSKEGFVYFALGSLVVIELSDERIILELYKSLGKIAPIKVLMKIRNPKKLPPGLPKNIRTFTWAPQYKVLQHRNIKAFVTHGGTLGTQEAIYCAVPMIGIPLMVDQFLNIGVYVKKNIAVKLNDQNLTEENVDYALNEILYNPIYKNAMVKISKKFRDRPMSPMDTATWWVEYVGRRGSKALRSPAMDLAWWQVQLLDVYVGLLLIASFAVFLTIFIIRFLVKLFIFKEPKVTSTKKLQ